MPDLDLGGGSMPINLAGGHATSDSDFMSSFGTGNVTINGDGSTNPLVVGGAVLAGVAVTWLAFTLIR